MRNSLKVASVLALIAGSVSSAQAQGVGVGLGLGLGLGLFQGLATPQPQSQERARNRSAPRSEPTESRRQASRPSAPRKKTEEVASVKTPKKSIARAITESKPKAKIASKPTPQLESKHVSGSESGGPILAQPTPSAPQAAAMTDLGSRAGQPSSNVQPASNAKKDCRASVPAVGVTLMEPCR